MKSIGKKAAAAAMVFVSLIIVLAFSGCLDGSEEAVCRYDLSVTETTHIGDYYESLGIYQHEAGAGYKFAVVTIRIVNDADESVSTNAFYWSLSASGIEYSFHLATYDDSIGHQSVDVGQGGDFTTKIVYEVPTSAADYSLSYEGFSMPDMEQDSSLL